MIYDLPKLDFSFLKNLKNKFRIKKNPNLKLFAQVIAASVIFGFIAGAISGGIFYFNYVMAKSQALPSIVQAQYSPQTPEEDAIIKVVKETSPAVVSIVVTKDLPVYQQYFEYTPFGTNVRQQQKGTQKQEVAQGSGFIVSKDGMILTNKHVVSDGQANYTVFTNSGKKYSAKVVAKDPVQDLAVIKIDNINQEEFPTVTLGNSDSINIGQTAIAIGNALGEFRNTVSVGVISGLGRNITASDPSGSGFVETLDDVIQTDAAINGGNSGGPLLNLRGEVVGINAAVVTSAQSIGFSIPINQAKRALEQVQTTGKITYPFLGVRYVLVSDEVKQEKNLSVDYGALVLSGDSGEPAVESGSAAAKAGIKEGDIVLEFAGQKITVDNPLSQLILNYKPGDTVSVKILRDGKEQTLNVVLGQRQ